MEGLAEFLPSNPASSHVISGITQGMAQHSVFLSIFWKERPGDPASSQTTSTLLPYVVLTRKTERRRGQRRGECFVEEAWRDPEAANPQPPLLRRKGRRPPMNEDGEDKSSPAKPMLKSSGFGALPVAKDN